MRRKTSLLQITLIMVMLLGTALWAAQEQATGEKGFKVIVNKDNPVSSMSAKEASRLFLKKVTKWDHDAKVYPVDHVVGSPVRESFSKDVLGKTVAEVNSYWQQMIFTGREVPPPKKGSDKEVIDFVKGNAGAIGYVSEETNTDDVKVLRISD